jgi:protein-L-isoaspartate(D-aspartate) O-methyltransferase
MKAAVLLILLFMAGCNGEVPMKAHDDALAQVRADMVRLLRQHYRIHDERVLAAMERIPRHLYIPGPFRNERDAYGDHPCPIDLGQTISQPFIVAYMTQALAVQPGTRVLEVGTGSGYQAAVLAELGARVYTIEIVPELAAHAKQVLEEQGYRNVALRCGDGYKGWPEEAPFDVIIVTCAPEEVPPALTEQLAEGGFMMIPIGTWRQQLVVLRKQDGEVIHETDISVRFVPMVRGRTGE